MSTIPADHWLNNLSTKPKEEEAKFDVIVLLVAGGGEGGGVWTYAVDGGQGGAIWTIDPAKTGGDITDHHRSGPSKQDGSE